MRALLLICILHLVSTTTPLSVSVLLNQTAVTEALKKEKRKKTLKTSALQKPSLPRFLTLADDTQRKEYVDIATNPNVQKGTKETALQAWATRCGSTVASAYLSFVTEQEQIQNAQQQKTAAIVAGLSEAAQAVNAKIMEVISNNNLTVTQEHKQINKIKKNTSTEVWDELSNALA